LLGHFHDEGKTVGGVGDRRWLTTGMAGVHLQLDDRAVQLACEFADFPVQAAVAVLGELSDQLRRVGETPLLEAFDQLRRMVPQSCVQLRGSLLWLRHSALAASTSAVDTA